MPSDVIVAKLFSPPRIFIGLSQADGSVTVTPRIEKRFQEKQLERKLLHLGLHLGDINLSFI